MSCAACLLLLFMSSTWLAAWLLAWSAVLAVRSQAVRAARIRMRGRILLCMGEPFGLGFVYEFACSIFNRPKVWSGGLPYGQPEKGFAAW